MLSNCLQGKTSLSSNQVYFWVEGIELADENERKK